MPKMKTHGLMKITGAVKNCYGFIPGMQKALYHTKGKDEKTFGELLIDIYLQCKDKIVINIMDAIVGMEGEGPGNGDPKNTGLVIASTDALALDVTQTRIMGFDPLKIGTTNAAIKRNLLNISDIKIIGDYKDSNIPKLDYKPAGAGKGITKFLTTAKSYLTKTPVLIPECNKDKCIKCGICAKLCPVQCITLSPYPTFDRNVCIKCYCCHEHCPQGAIFLKR
jgi:Pyruvate/2-oxoacid:ferredoxin oxidoreductase delta subunit